MNKRNFLTVITTAAVALTWSALTIAALPSLESIPNGIMDGRIDVKYGTYATVVQQSARPFQDRLSDLENKAHGLASLTGKVSFVDQAQLIYLLEHEIVRFNREVADAPKEKVSDFERSSMIYASIRAYDIVRTQAERVYENMIRYIDHKIPGPNGLQIRTELKHIAESIYAPNYRSDKELSDAERKAEYDKKLTGFLQKGGSLGEIHKFTPELYKSFGGYTRVEYTELENGDLMITEGNAGHLLLAQGAKVKSAGQIVFIKSASGESTMLIVTNASGTYKPDLLSANQLAETLAIATKTSPERVIMTKGEPLSSQAVKVYLKADGVDPAEISKRVKELEDAGKNLIQKTFGGAICGAAFAA